MQCKHQLTWQLTTDNWTPVLTFFFQRSSTAEPTSIGTSFTRSMRTVSSKTDTGSSRSSQSWHHSTAWTMKLTAVPQTSVTDSETLWTKNRAGMLPVVTFLAPPQRTAFWRWGHYSSMWWFYHKSVTSPHPVQWVDRFQEMLPTVQKLYKHKAEFKRQTVRQKLICQRILFQVLQKQTFFINTMFLLLFTVTKNKYCGVL